MTAQVNTVMKEGKHHLVANFKIGLVFFLLVMSVFIYMSYEAINKDLSQSTEEPPQRWRFLQDLSNLSFPVDKISSSRLQRKSDRILCLIMTRETDLQTKTRAINTTWAKRCDKYFYLLTSQQQRHDFLSMDLPDNRFTIVYKIRRAFEIIYKQYINEFDWILKTDDDTYVIIENLRYLLAKHNSSEPGHLGYVFNRFFSSGYMSGGAGYVISKAGFMLMLENGILVGNCSIPVEPDDPEKSEDVETGRCLEKVGVPVISSLDSEGRETFHPYPPYKHLIGPLPNYIVQYGKNPVIIGEGCCSKYSTTFHYLSPTSIYKMEQIIYSKNRALPDSSTQGLELPLDELKSVSY